MNDHLVYVDDSPDGELHLSLECRRAGAATSHDVDPAACAAELGAWLDARAGRRWGAVSITTSRVHNGDMTPVLDALVARRPQLGRLALGAIAFPDFERGSYVPEDLDKDGSSWRISVLGDEGAARLRGHFPRFAHLDRLTLTGNAITQQGAAALRDLGPNIVVGWQRMMDPEEMCFDPPMVSLFNDG